MAEPLFTSEDEPALELLMTPPDYPAIGALEIEFEQWSWRTRFSVAAIIRDCGGAHA